MSADEVSNDIRMQLTRCCGSRHSRTAIFTRNRPTHWSPGEVRNPRNGEPFTQDGAWEFVATLLAEGSLIEAISLDVPPGKTGYVMVVPGFGRDQIYIKLQLGSGLVIGRSFHISTRSE